MAVAVAAGPPLRPTRDAARAANPTEAVCSTCGPSRSARWRITSSRWQMRSSGRGLVMSDDRDPSRQHRWRDCQHQHTDASSTVSLTCAIITRKVGCASVEDRYPNLLPNLLHNEEPHRHGIPFQCLAHLEVLHEA